MEYYYLIASLPALRLGGPVPISPAALRARCAEQMSPGDLEELDRVVEGVGRSAFARAWADVEGGLRNVCARERARMRGSEPPAMTVTSRLDLTLQRQVRDAFATAHPLERERRLDELRWQRLDELARQRPFGPGAVLAYRLQLGLAVRWAGIEVEAGRAQLARRLEAMLARFDAAGVGAEPVSAGG